MRLWALTLAMTLAASGVMAKQKHSAHHKQTTVVAQSASPQDPNGVWTVEAATTVGACPSLIPSTLTLAENKIASAEGVPVQAWGYVEDGSIVARFTGEGQHVARFHGTLKGGRGTGAWSSSTDMCGGTWRAAQE